MGQVALGLRSLVVRTIVFVVMAALLAWALGGTLWPRPVSAIQRPVVDASGSQWGWMVTVSSVDQEVFYTLARRREGQWELIEGGGPFPAVEPLVTPVGTLPEGVVFMATLRDDNAARHVLVGSDGKAFVSTTLDAASAD
ncbi:MAG: hypothetical protein QF561_01155 [Phycisphaerales bacterium]|jgi:hypothetical protein|nr:hypothetical protein [Phycisphaerales bacterium]